MTDEFRQAAGRIHDATSYRDVFLVGDTQSIKAAYRGLARILHPDRVVSDRKAEASAVFDRLSGLYQAASQALQDGRFYESAPLVVFDSQAMRHEVATELRRYFDMTTGYRARSTRGATVTDSIIKVAQVPADNELLAAEADALGLLAGTGDEHTMFFPELLDSFAVADGRRRLRANAITRLDGFVNLEEVRARYPKGLHPLDMAWMWRRVLWTLGGAHEVGVLHGALVPSNILIYPAMHGVVLADWCYSVTRVDTTYPPLKAVVGVRRDWYSKNILQRKAPTTAHDVALAARSMQFLTEGADVPNLMKQYFARCVGGDESRSAYELLAQFDTILQHLGAPYYPRLFRPLNW